jgi:hypothetical protein
MTLPGMLELGCNMQFQPSSQIHTSERYQEWYSILGDDIKHGALPVFLLNSSPPSLLFTLPSTPFEKSSLDAQPIFVASLLRQHRIDAQCAYQLLTLPTWVALIKLD